MSVSTQIVGSSMETLAQHYQIITHNLANASTAGFKRHIRAASEAPSTKPHGRGRSIGNVKDSSAIDFTPGKLIRTGKSLDVALGGTNAFFVIETPNGPLYTRDGAFRTNQQGQMVDSSGRLVGGASGPITFPSTVSLESVSIAKDGAISAEGKSLGSLKIVGFDDLTQLSPVGRGCFIAAGPPKDAQETAQVAQGFQETSNVSIVEELVNLITVTRMYEANVKSIEAQNEKTQSLLRVAMG